MKTLAAIAAVLLAATASAQGIAKPAKLPPEYLLWQSSGIGLTNGTNTGGYGLPTRALTITAVSFSFSASSGGGAGNTVITITDGTNTCTATVACTASVNGVTVRAAAVNGAGTGCNYAAGAVLNSSVSTAGCTTTQPTVRNIGAVGFWR